MNRKKYKIVLSSLVISSFFVFAFVVENNPAHATSVLRVAETQVQYSLPQVSVYDFSSDDSLQRYLSADTPFSDVNYAPADLVSIDSAFTANNSKSFQLRQESAIQFADMAWHFRNDFDGDKLWISSAYRSNDFQEYMLKKGCSRAKCALPGTSEHQGGLALDLKVIAKGGKGYALSSGNKYYQWFADNAHKRGFHNSYQKGIDVDGQMVEGRHRRYMGTGLATQLRDKGLTFAEWFKQNN